MNKSSELALKHAFYREVLAALTTAELPVMVGGTYAFTEYTGVRRETKDMDLFCKAGDYPRIMKLLADRGCETEITDARWLAKVSNEDAFIDLIFSDVTGRASVDDTWFEHAPSATILDQPVLLMPLEEFIWSKAYVQDRYRFDGADINHLILKQGEMLDWHRLLQRMEQHWQLLLCCLLNFRFVYPSERRIVPKWLMYELIDRLQNQLEAPIPKDRVCRGPLLSRTQYVIDIEAWGFQAFN